MAAFIRRKGREVVKERVHCIVACSTMCCTVIDDDSFVRRSLLFEMSNIEFIYFKFCIYI